VISARILAKFGLSLDAEAISIVQVPIHDLIQKIKGVCFFLLFT